MGGAAAPNARQAIQWAEMGAGNLIFFVTPITLVSGLAPGAIVLRVDQISAFQTQNALINGKVGIRNDMAAFVAGYYLPVVGH